MPSRVPPNSSSDNNTTNMSICNSRLDLSTSITSPLRRIPSFVAEEEDFEEEFARSSMKSSPSTAGPNKKKRTHSVEVIENEFGQLNRLQEDQSLQKKRLTGLECNFNSNSSPLRQKEEKTTQTIAYRPVNPSWSSRLGNFRKSIQAHRKNSDFDAWSREIWNLGSWWLEVAGEESAGIICDLIKEFNSSQSKSKKQIMIPSISGNIHLDLLHSKALTLMGKYEEASEICKLSRASKTSIVSDESNEMRFIEGCVSRVSGKISSAIEAFEGVLLHDPGHLEAHAHLYGFTCGLLPYKAISDDEDFLVQAYRTGNYSRVINRALKDIWTGWLGADSVLVLLTSSLACTFDSGSLYGLGQRSVTERPESSITWYCVGLFYQIIGRTDEARRYLFKAGIGSKLKKSGIPDSGIGPAWIALGHSFASYGDHDQAVSAYVAAIRTHCPGSLEPCLYLAIEYLRVRQPVLAAAYLVDAHAIDGRDPRVLNELACLQALKENYSAAKTIISKALEVSCELPDEFRFPLALNYCVICIKEAMQRDGFGDLEGILNHCIDAVLGPLLVSAKKSLGMTSTPPCNTSALSIFPWTANSAHPSAEHGLLFVTSVIQEWRALLASKRDMSLALSYTESALEGYRLLLECRNEHRNTAMEAILMERQYRLLTAHSNLSVEERRPVKVSDSCATSVKNVPMPTGHFRTPRTPLIRSHSLALHEHNSSSSSNSSFLSSTSGHGLQTPIMSFSAGALPTAYALGLGSAASSIAASVSRRRLSLRRQMTGLRFDPADTSTSFSSFESDNSFMSSLGGTTAMVTSIQVNEDLMTTDNFIANQSMMVLLDEDDEIDGGDETNSEPKTNTIFNNAFDQDNMRLDSD